MKPLLLSRVASLSLSQAASVSPLPYVGVVLVGGSGPHEGAVHVEGQPVCDDMWELYLGEQGNTNAGVVCR